MAPFFHGEMDMYKRKVVKPNCFFNTGNGLQALEIGTIVETTSPDLFGDKAVTVGGGQLEVATPEPEPVPESGSDLEEELRAFILEKTGKNAGGNCKIATLKRQAKKLGWSE